MASSYPGSLDDFSTTSPAKLGNDDSTARTHSERHNDVESAVEAIEAELGTDPAGAQATVKERLDAMGAFAAVGQFYWPAGGYISQAFADGITTNTGTLSSGVLYYSPIWVPFAATVTEIMIQVTSGATGAAYLGLYDSAVSGQPSNLVVDGGTISTTATGVKTVTISQAVSQGLYWVGHVCNAGPAFAAVDADALRLIATNSSFGKVRGFTQSHTYGALPSSASSLSTYDGATLVGLRRAT